MLMLNIGDRIFGGDTLSSWTKKDEKIKTIVFCPKNVM